MVTLQAESCFAHPELSGSRKSWTFAVITGVADLPPLLEAITRAMARLGYPEKDVFGVRLAVEEALVNSIKHGHKYDPSKQVEVRFLVNGERVLLKINDQGEGFDPSNVPDPTRLENLERSSGRGLLLMGTYLSSVRYSAKGNSVTLCKYHSPSIERRGRDSNPR